VTELVNLALQIQAATQLNKLAKSVNQTVQIEVDSLQHKRDYANVPIHQIHIKNEIDETEKDINRMILLVVVLFGIVLLLLGFVGCIILWETKKSNDVPPGCTLLYGLAIGDGICDDRLNNHECDFDGDDCCLHTNSNMSFCEICNCNLGKC
jgi:hypothetical protein